MNLYAQIVQTILAYFVHGFMKAVKVTNDTRVLHPRVDEERPDMIYWKQKVLVPWRLHDF